MATTPQFIAVNKPKGMSSFHVISYVRKASNVRRVGHAGTLDPLASGVLVVAVGRQMTKQLDRMVKKEKEYEAEIFLGAFSTTDDEEGKKTHINVQTKPTIAHVKKVLKNLEGTIDLVPPQFSAIKVDGKRAYKMARKGENVSLKPRPSKIDRITNIVYAWPMINITAVTGPGVYIRSLARKIGEDLGCGAYVKELKRTRVGEHRVEDALDISDLDGYFDRQNKL